jgi:hypothetical protein
MPSAEGVFSMIVIKIIEKPAIKSYPPAGGPRLQKFLTLLWPTLTKKGETCFVILKQSPNSPLLIF